MLITMLLVAGMLQIVMHAMRMAWQLGLLLQDVNGCSPHNQSTIANTAATHLVLVVLLLLPWNKGEAR
jgi:hypothetical protein